MREGESVTPAASESAAAKSAQPATMKLDAAQGKGGFRVEMTAGELQAVLQDALVLNPDNPLRRVDVKVADGPPTVRRA